MAGRMCFGALIAVLAAVTDVNSFFLPAPVLPLPIVPFVRPYFFPKRVRAPTPVNSRLFNKQTDLPPVEGSSPTLMVNGNANNVLSMSNGNANNVLSMPNGLDFGRQNLVIANSNNLRITQALGVDPLQATTLNGGAQQVVNTDFANPIVYTEPRQSGTDVQVISDYGNGQNGFSNDLNGVQVVSDYGQNGFSNDLNGVQVVSDYGQNGLSNDLNGVQVVSDYGQNGVSNDLNGVQVVSDYSNVGAMAAQPVGQSVW